MEIAIGGPNLADAMLFHERGNMKIMKPAGSDLWILARQTADHLSVPVRLDQNLERRKGLQRFDEAPRLRKREWVSKNGALRRDAQEFVDDSPRDKPCFRGRTPLAHEPLHLTLVGEVFIGRVNQQVCVNDEHRQSLSLAPYRRACRPASSTR